MILETFKHFEDFELLDSGNGYRLERWGDVVLQRPDPQIIWQRSLPGEEWDKAWAIFKSGSDEEKGRWDFTKAMPSPWAIQFQDIQLLLKLSPFKHTGLFAEQAANWEWMLGRLKIEDLGLKNGMQAKSEIKNQQPVSPSASRGGSKILNLFGYTGGATMVLAKAGCFVTHVDASKPAITWANENQKLNKIDKEFIRWILDDAAKFVKREIKRGAQYDGIIMDPPAFGHSPTGKTWKFNRDLPELLNDCVSLLSPEARFLIVNGYATNSSALALNNVLEDALKGHTGKIECGELCLKQTSGRQLSTGIFARWNN